MIEGPKAVEVKTIQSAKDRHFRVQLYRTINTQQYRQMIFAIMAGIIFPVPNFAIYTHTIQSLGEAHRSIVTAKVHIWRQ